MFTRWRKARLRKSARALRASAHAASLDSARRLVDQFPDALWPALHSVVSGYHPIQDEISPLALMETFHCEQARIALPCVAELDTALEFRAWVPGDELTRDASGVPSPPDKAVKLTPQLVLVPLLAFDRTGRRLGYGGGYYDRSLKALRQSGDVTAVGLAYACQEVKRVPSDGHDENLDWVITEAEAIRCQS
jgi:5-formyltetrahydrofolate cyclo-ligase